VTLRLKDFGVRRRVAPAQQAGLRQVECWAEKGNEVAGTPGDTRPGGPTM